MTVYQGRNGVASVQRSVEVNEVVGFHGVPVVRDPIDPSQSSFGDLFDFLSPAEENANFNKSVPPALQTSQLHEDPELKDDDDEKEERCPKIPMKLESSCQFPRAVICNLLKTPGRTQKCLVLG